MQRHEPQLIARKILIVESTKEFVTGKLVEANGQMHRIFIPIQ